MSIEEFTKDCLYKNIGDTIYVSNEDWSYIRNNSSREYLDIECNPTLVVNNCCGHYYGIAIKVDKDLPSKYNRKYNICA